MSDEWGAWIEHGRLRPAPLGVSIGMTVQFDTYDRGIYTTEVSQLWNWSVVIRYRIRKPRALKQLREIARNPERELEDA